METDEHAAFFCDVAHRQPGPLTVTPGFAVDRREQFAGAHARDVPERVLEHALLDCDLRGRIQVLQAAAAANAEMRAGRRYTRGARGVKLGHACELVVGLAAKDFDGDALADQRAFDEDGLAVDAGDASAFLIERGDDDGIHGLGLAKTVLVVVGANSFARYRDMERRSRMNSALRNSRQGNGFRRCKFIRTRRCTVATYEVSVTLYRVAYPLPLDEGVPG